MNVRSTGKFKDFGSALASELKWNGATSRSPVLCRDDLLHALLLAFFTVCFFVDLLWL